MGETVVWYSGGLAFSSVLSHRGEGLTTLVNVKDLCDSRIIVPGTRPAILEAREEIYIDSA